MVPHNGIMTDMGMSHEKIMRANRRGFGGSARSMNRHMFPKDILVADVQPAYLATIF
jgi:hypothetical protein